MFLKVVNKKDISGAFVILILTVVTVFSLIYLLSSTAEGEELPQNGLKYEDRKKYINEIGYKVDESFEETKKSVEIPFEFSDVYNEYNIIQKKAGFDLEKFKGEKATLYTLKLCDEKRNDLYANLIILKGSIIGGDICAVDFTNGYMLPLFKSAGA